MKHYPILFITLLSLSVSMAQNTTAEQNAVRKVIDLESQYFFAHNYDKWAATWAYEPTSYWTYSSRDLYNEGIGWKTISAGIKDKMKYPQSLSGKWKYVNDSYKTESAQPADSNFKQISMDYDVHENPYGIEFGLISLSSYAGKPSTSLATEDFIGDKMQRTIRYFDYQKDNDNVSATTGTASFDTSGRFIVKGMYDDKPALIHFENIYTFMPDGLLHHEGRSYDTNGKVTFKWFFDLKRL